MRSFAGILKNEGKHMNTIYLDLALI